MNRAKPWAQLCCGVMSFALAACSAAHHQAGSQPSGSGAAGGLLAQVKERGTLLISTDPNYKPQSFRNADGTWVGFDVDVGREIARRIGVTPAFSGGDFDRITRGSWRGAWDVNIDSMAITPARSKALFFTQPYYFTPAAFAVRRDSRAKSIADLAGKRIGAGVATTYELYLNGKMPSARVPRPRDVVVVTYDTDALALDDLASGDGKRLDGVLTALPTITAAIRAGQPFRVLGKAVFFDASAIALDRSSAKDPRPLLWTIDSTVGDMLRDGTLRRLSLHYYGLDLTRRH